MAGVVLADSFSAAESVAKSRMRDGRRCEASFSSRRGRRQISLVLYCSRAALRVALDGDASLAAAGSRLLVFLLARAACSRRAGHRGVLPARGMTISTGAGFVPFCSRVEQLLDPSRHVEELIGSQPIELLSEELATGSLTDYPWLFRKFIRPLGLQALQAFGPPSRAGYH